MSKNKMRVMVGSCLTLAALSSLSLTGCSQPVDKPQTQLETSAQNPSTSAIPEAALDNACNPQVVAEFKSSPLEERKFQSISLNIPKTWAAQDAMEGHALVVAGVGGLVNIMITDTQLTPEDKAQSIDSLSKSFLDNYNQSASLEDIKMSKQEKVKVDGKEALEVQYSYKVRGLPGRCRFLFLNHSGHFLCISYMTVERLAKDFVPMLDKSLDSVKIGI